MADLFYDRFIGDGVTDVPLSSHVPTRPLASGATAWEYTGAAADYRIRDYHMLTCSSAFDGQVARINAAFDHTRLEIWANLFKLGVDNVSDTIYFCFFVPNTAIGSYTNISYLRIGLARTGTGGVRGGVQWVDAAGVVTTLATGRDFSFPLQSGPRRIFATVVEDVVSLYAAESDGALHATLLVRARVPSALMVAGNDHIGLILTSGNDAAGTALIDLTVRDQVADMVPFPFRFNWPMQEQYAYLTDVLTADDGSEQRIAVRNPALPRRVFRKPLATFTRDETEHLMALLFGSNPMTVWVPEWWNAAVVSVNVVIGDTVVNVLDSADREYNAVDDLTGPPKYVLLWTAPDTWEIHVVEIVSATSIQFYWATIHAFTKGVTYILPLAAARLPESVDVVRPARHMAETELEFLVDA